MGCARSRCGYYPALQVLPIVPSVPILPALPVLPAYSACAGFDYGYSGYGYF